MNFDAALLTHFALSLDPHSHYLKLEAFINLKIKISHLLDLFFNCQTYTILPRI